LFRPIVTERDALEGIENQIELLRTANSTPNGFFALIDKGNNSNNTEPFVIGIKNLELQEK